MTDEESPDVHAAKQRHSPRSKIVLGSQFRSCDLSKVEVVSRLLSGKEICVISGFGEVTKSDVERKVAEYGGSIVQNPGNFTQR